MIQRQFGKTMWVLWNLCGIFTEGKLLSAARLIIWFVVLSKSVIVNSRINQNLKVSSSKLFKFDPSQWGKIFSNNIGIHFFVLVLRTVLYVSSHPRFWLSNTRLLIVCTLLSPYFMISSISKKGRKKLIFESLYLKQISILQLKFTYAIIPAG